tara:strand:+ start:43132 stop:44088 length:957 start_codon:yes stop_codon:yes gene_type:complete
MKIFVAGSKGMVGKAIVKQLRIKNKIEIIESPRSDLDLLNQAEVSDFFSQTKPDIVVIAAAKVGGIHANSTYPAEFIYENLMIQCNLIHQSYLSNIKKLLFLGSSCIYPVDSPQPMKESHLLSGKLEPTNEPYAVAKIAGIKLCTSYNRQYNVDYRAIMPTNLYGPGDNFSLEDSHVIPALIRKIHEAKCNNEDRVNIWGSGKPLREFLHVDDMATASLFVLNLDKEVYKKKIISNCSHINIGSGVESSIVDLSQLICEVIDYQGELIFDQSKPDGSPRKLLDISAMNELGWKASIGLKEGLESTYKWYLANLESVRR